MLKFGGQVFHGVQTDSSKFGGQVFHGVQMDSSKFGVMCLKIKVRRQVFKFLIGHIQ